MRKRIILITVLVLLLTMGVYGAITWYQITHPEDLFNLPTNNDPGTTENPPAAGHSNTDEEIYQFTESKLNLLLLGLDANVERYKTMGVFRTDTIMLASIDFFENKVDLISVPRDSYVKIPGRKERGRVNAAFVYGGGFEKEGFPTTLQTVSDLLGGITIHYYAAIDMNAFIKVIDGLGGITYDVDVPIANAGIQPGLQKLDGKNALAYARHRKTAGGDIDRVNRQQQLMTGVLNQLKSTDSLTKLPTVYEAIKDDVWTNLNVKQIAALALFATKMNMEDLQRHMVPGTYLDMDNISYWGIDQNKKNQMIHNLFGIKITTYDREDDVNYIKEQLRKKLAELKQLAQKWIEQGIKVLTEQESVLLDEEKTRINDRVRLLENGIEKGELEDIELDAHGLEMELSSLTPQLKQRKNVVDSGISILAMLEEELPRWQDKLSDDDQEQLNVKILSLQLKIQEKRFEDIPVAATELNNHWDNLKERLDVKPTPPPSPTPSESPSPAPSSAPEETPTPELTEAPTSTPTTTPILTPEPDNSPDSTP